MTIFEKWAKVPARRPVAFYLGAALAIVFVTLAIYQRTFHYAYLDWDDNTLVEQNPYVIYPPYGEHALDLFVPGRTPGPHLPVRTASYIFDRAVLGSGLPERLAPGQSPDSAWIVPNTHHVVNVMLYALNGLLLLWVLARLLPPWAAVIASLIWIAHPLHAEGVCWVSGRKEMLAGGFVFGALLAYMYGTERLGPGDAKQRPALASLGLTIAAAAVSAIAIYHPVVHVGFVQGLVSLGFALAACIAYGVLSGGERRWSAGILLAVALLSSLAGALSKPVAICIGPILLAWELGYRPRRDAHAQNAKKMLDSAAAQTGLRRWILSVFPSLPEIWGAVLRLVPQAAVAVWGAYMTLFLARRTQVLKTATWNAAPTSQGNAALGALWLDIYHLVAPLDLSALYDVKSDHWYWQTYAGLAIGIAIPIAAIWLLWKNPRSLIWLAFWLVPLIPVSGIVRLASIHADRYLYLPAVALAVGLGLLLATAAFGNDQETGSWERWLAAALTVCIVGGFSMLSVKRARIWAQDVTLWGDAVEKNPDLPSARNNYGAALMNAQRVDEALEQYYAAYKLLPSLDVAQFNIAATEMRKGHPETARKYAEEFNAQHKEMPTGWILLGNCYQQNSKLEESKGNKAEAAELLKKSEDAYLSGCKLSVDANSILQLQDRITACNQVAGLRAMEGNDAGALEAYDLGLSYADPGSTAQKAVLIARARYWAMKKDYDKALADLAKLPAADPDVVRGRATIDYQKGDYARALEEVDGLLQSGRGQQKDLQMRNALMQLMQQGKTGLDNALESQKSMIPVAPTKPGSQGARAPSRPGAASSVSAR